jgi:hypothetical protein
MSSSSLSSIFRSESVFWLEGSTSLSLFSFKFVLLRGGVRWGCSSPSAERCVEAKEPLSSNVFEFSALVSVVSVCFVVLVCVSSFCFSLFLLWDLVFSFVEEVFSSFWLPPTFSKRSSGRIAFFFGLFVVEEELSLLLLLLPSLFALSSLEIWLSVLLLGPSLSTTVSSSLDSIAGGGIYSNINEQEEEWE